MKVNQTIILFFLFLLITSIAKAQVKSFTIPLKKKWASDFYFINDSNRMACLYLDLNDTYQFVLIDSNYTAINIIPDGSIHR